MKPIIQPGSRKEDHQRFKALETAVPSPDAHSSVPEEDTEPDLTDLLLREAAHLPPPGPDLGKCPDEEQLERLAKGQVVEGAWRHVARCNACRMKVLAGRNAEAPAPKAKPLQRLLQTLSGWLAIPDVPVGWKLAPAGTALLALGVIALRWDRPAYVNVAAYAEGEVELASNGLLSASPVDAAPDGGRNAQLERARTTLRPVYPGGVVAFRLIGTQPEQKGLPPEVFVVLQPEDGGPRRILEAQALVQGATLTVVVEAGQSWPKNAPLRVGMALGTDLAPQADVQKLLLDVALPDSLAAVVAPLTAEGTAPTANDQKVWPESNDEYNRTGVQTHDFDGLSIDKGNNLGCATCETGKGVPPADAAAGAILDLSRTSAGAAPARSAGETLQNPGILSAPLPMKCRPLSIDSWWVCDLPMRLKVQQ